MTEKQLKSGLRLSHRVVGAASAVLVLVAAISGFLLQYPGWLGSPPEPRLALAVDPMDPDRLLRGFRWGVEQTLDRGRTWTEIPMLEAPTDVFRIVFSPADPAVVRALGRDGLVESFDGGRIWQSVPVGPLADDPGLVLRDLGVGAGGEIYLLTSAGLLVRDTDAAAWRRLADGDHDGAGLHRFVHDLHTGHLFGTAGRRVAEFGALALVFVTLTGLILYRRNGKVFRP